MAACLHSYVNHLLHSLSLCFVLVDSKYIEGVLNSAENWAFLSRFCFITRGGQYEYVFHYPSEYEVQNLLVYYDEPHQWKAVYKKNMTCYQKEAVLRKNLKSTQIVTLASEVNGVKIVTNESNPGCHRVNKTSDGRFWYRCNNRWTFKSARNRWWYMAVSNCESKRGVYLEYKIEMLNGNLSDSPWFAHFSADEFYIIHHFLTFFVIYVLLVVLSLYAAYGLRERGLLHTTFKLYLSSIVFEMVGLMFSFVHYNEFAKDGVGIPHLHTIGRMLQAISSLLFIYLVLLLGKGYTITRARLSTKSSVRLTIFMTSYSVCFLVLFIYEIVVFDPAEVLYFYESPGGYGILVLRVLGWFMLLYAVGFTLKHHPHKLPFYVPFLLFYSLWFLSAPILVLIITYVIDNWVRETVSVGIDLSISLLGHAFFLNLTWPTSANKNFPFHIKTTQVRAMAQYGNINGISDPLSLDNFSRHPYEAPPIKANQRINDVLRSHHVEDQDSLTTAAVGVRRGNRPSLTTVYTLPTLSLNSFPLAEPMTR